MRPIIRRVGTLAALLLAAGCSLAGPPPAPAPVRTPSFEGAAPDVDDLDAAPSFSPPPPSAEEREDLILGSALVRDPEVRRRVNYWILRWQTWGEGYFTRYLERMERYGDLVDAELVDRGLPRSLRYLPVIESGYNPVAESRAGAVGMWQFMSGTARFLGLDVTPLIDERRDPWRSTDVALDYLSELGDRFDGSWFLALAAYNSGWGRVQRILDRYGHGARPSDSLFWSLRGHFPQETRDFVPKLLAAARLARDPEAYGFEPGDSVPPAQVEQVRVPDATSLDVVASAAGVDEDEIERLNPQLLRGYTPPDRETALRVPTGTAERFRVAYARIPTDQRVSFVEHKIRSGQTLSWVAAHYHVGMAELRAANPRIQPRRLQIGQWVVVPRSPTATSGSEVRRIAAADVGRRGPNAGDPVARLADRIQGNAIVHRVGSGESLWLIARRYDVHVTDLRRWNDLGADAVIHPGDELRVSDGSEAVYRVRAGDTLSDIALRHGVPTKALLQANDLGWNAVIRPGDEVRIP